MIRYTIGLILVALICYGIYSFSAPYIFTDNQDTNTPSPYPETIIETSSSGSESDTLYDVVWYRDDFIDTKTQSSGVNFWPGEFQDFLTHLQNSRNPYYDANNASSESTSWAGNIGDIEDIPANHPSQSSVNSASFDYEILLSQDENSSNTSSSSEENMLSDQEESFLEASTNSNGSYTPSGNCNGIIYSPCIKLWEPIPANGGMDFGEWRADPGTIFAPEVK